MNQTLAKAESACEVGELSNSQTGILIAGGTENQENKWSPPPQGCFKVNVDAGLKSNGEEVGLGAVFRNSSGEVVGVAAESELFLDDMERAEAQAIKLGISIGQQAGFIPLIIESDAKNVVDLIKGNIRSKKEINWIVKDICSMAYEMKDVVFQFKSRACNGAAHALAKVACNYPVKGFWRVDIPSIIICNLFGLV